MSEFTSKRIRSVLVLKESPNFRLIERWRKPVAVVYDSVDADFLLECLNNMDEIKILIENIKNSYPNSLDLKDKHMHGGM